MKNITTNFKTDVILLVSSSSVSTLETEISIEFSKRKFADIFFHANSNPVTSYIFRLLPHIKGNIGFVFTKEDLNEVREIIRSNKVAAPAKAGAIAPIDVKVAPVNTGLGPEKTSFFQALAIPTKITRGTIEILVREKIGNDCIDS